ncbi:unnamed protein product [Lymnaea stagnalis]|uniref:WAP domain-containing protein n=1 Tax=Lymnaea stagnalis TaxID=6523 RepID=A0AAV2ICT2_LYMST
MGCPTGTQGVQGTGTSCVPVVVPTCLPPIPPIDQCGGCPQGQVCKPSGVNCLVQPCPTSECVNYEPQLGSCPKVSRFLPLLNFACLGEKFRVRFCASDENCRKDLSERCCISQCNRRVCTAVPVVH